MASNKYSRKLKKEWLTIFPCISAVVDDDTKFHCTVCGETFLASSKTRVQDHIDSIQHQIKAGLRTETPISSAKKRKFSTKWLYDRRFKDWLEVVDGDDSKFFCSLCGVTQICSSGEYNVLKHASSSLHTSNCREANMLTVADVDPEIVYEDKYAVNEACKRAEIQFVDLLSRLHIPFAAASEMLNFFQNVDPLVLKCMKVGDTKASSIVRNVLAPVEEDRIIEILRKNRFSVYVDETTDPNGSTKVMNFTVRYVDQETFEVRDRFVKFIKLDASDLSAERLFSHFKEFLDKSSIPISNIISVACDNASVMIGKNKSFKTFFLGKNPLAEVIPCISHRLNLCAKASFDQIPGIDSLLQTLVHYMNNPKQAAIFAEHAYAYQATSLKILPYSKTRWLSRHRCIERLRFLYPSLQTFFRERCYSDPSGKVVQISDDLSSQSTQAYLAFCDYALNEFNKFIAIFQSEKTMIHLLYRQCENFMKWLARHFLKPALMPHYPANYINVEDQNNQKPLDQVHLGLECNDLLSKLAEDTSNHVMITEVRKNCLNFFIQASTACSEKFKDYFTPFYSKLIVFEAEVAIYDENRGKSFSDVSWYATRFGNFDTDKLEEEWFAIHQDLSTVKSLADLSFDNLWKKVSLYKELDGSAKYPEVGNLVSHVRSLTHSNSAAERDFSALTDISTKKRNRLSHDSINGIALSKLSAKHRNTDSQSLEVTDEHLRLMSSDQLYRPAQKRSCVMRLFRMDDDEPMDDEEPLVE